MPPFAIPPRSLLVALLVTGAVACAPAPVRTAATPRLGCGGSPPRWEPSARAGGPVVRVALSAPDSRSGWDVYGGQRLREALRAWNAVGLPFRLVEAVAWPAADVRVVVLRQLPPDTATTGELARYRAGFTRRLHDDAGHIVQAWVAVAEQSGEGESFTVPDQVGTLLHELGHALGLPHASSTLALMSPRPRVEVPTETDIRMARALYRTSCGTSVAVAR